MPKDVVLGEGRMGEALLQAYPGQYRDSASESAAFDASTINLGQPGAYCGRPMAVGDPDMPAHDMRLIDIPGVGQVVAPEGEIMTAVESDPLRPSPIQLVEVSKTRKPYGRHKNPGLINLYTKPSRDVVIPRPPKLPGGPPVMRYKPQGVGSISPYPQDMASISPFPQDMAGVTDYPQDIAGLGETDAEKVAMREYYSAMLARGLEIAENVKGVADQWATMQAMKAEARQRSTELVLQGIPGQNDETVGAYLAPALAKIDNLFLDAEDKLMDMAALQGWMEQNLTANVIPTMQSIQSSLGIGYIESSKAESILASVGAGRPAANMLAENWLLSAFSGVAAYLDQVAPGLTAAKVNIARQQRMAVIVQNEINKAAPAMMAKLGMTQDEVNQAMKQIGLGNPVVFLVVLAVVLAIGMTAAGAAAIYYRGVAKSACDVGLAGVAKIDAAWRAEYQTLLDKAKAGASTEELNATASAAGQRMTTLTDSVANDIRNAKPGDLGIATYLVTGVVVVGAAAIIGKYFGLF